MKPDLNSPVPFGIPGPEAKHNSINHDVFLVDDQGFQL